LVYASTGRSINPPIDLFKSTDGAQNWEKVSGDLPKRFILDIAVHPENEDWVYVAIGGYKNSHLYKSEDGAATWQAIGDALPDVPINSILIDTVGINHLYVGNDIGVYVSDDDGVNWEVLQRGLPDAILAMDLSISPVDRQLRVATHGSGVYQRPLVEETVAPMDTVIMANDELNFDVEINIGPNPVDDILYIQSKAKPLKVARLYSANGQLIKSVSFESSHSKIEIFMAELPKGFYQLILEGEGALHREKIIKL